MREHTACTCGDSATKAQAHPAPGMSTGLTSRNCKRYFATAPSGMHPLGSVCSGLLPCIGILNGLWRRPLARHLGSTSSSPPSATPGGYGSPPAHLTAPGVLQPPPRSHGLVGANQPWSGPAPVMPPLPAGGWGGMAVCCHPRTPSASRGCPWTGPLPIEASCMRRGAQPGAEAGRVRGHATWLASGRAKRKPKYRVREEGIVVSLMGDHEG